MNRRANHLATLLAVGAAMADKNLIMRGDGENVEVFEPDKPRFKSDSALVEKIKADSRKKQAEKQARRAARFR